MGDDKPPYSAKESLQIHLLPRMASPNFLHYPLQLTLPPETYARTCDFLPILYLTKILRNKKYMASTRPILHIPSLLLHAPHRHSMGNCIHQLRRLSRAVDTPLRFRTFSRCVVIGCYGSVLPGGEAAGTGHCGVTGEEEAAGVVHTGWGG